MQNTSRSPLVPSSMEFTLCRIRSRLFFSKEKKTKVPSPPILEAKKHPRITIVLLEKKIGDLSGVIYTPEQRIDEEHVYRKSLQCDLNALNHFVAKMKK